MSYLRAINYHLYLFEKRCEPASTQPKLRLNEFSDFLKVTGKWQSLKHNAVLQITKLVLFLNHFSVNSLS